MAQKQTRDVTLDRSGDDGTEEAQIPSASAQPARDTAVPSATAGHLYIDDKLPFLDKSLEE